MRAARREKTCCPLKGLLAAPFPGAARRPFSDYHLPWCAAARRPRAAPEVTVEVHLANGLPSFSIVGPPDLEVCESHERVRVALQNCGLDFPVRRIIVLSS